MSDARTKADRFLVTASWLANGPSAVLVDSIHDTREAARAAADALAAEPKNASEGVIASVLRVSADIDGRLPALEQGDFARVCDEGNELVAYRRL